MTMEKPTTTDAATMARVPPPPPCSAVIIRRGARTNRIYIDVCEDYHGVPIVACTLGPFTEDVTIYENPNDPMGACGKQVINPRIQRVVDAARRHYVPGMSGAEMWELCVYSDLLPNVEVKDESHE